MLRGAAAAVSEKGAGRRNPVGRRREDFHQTGTGKGLVLLGQDRPDFFPGGGEGHEDDLSIMPGHAIAAVGNFGDGEFDRPGAGRGRTLQYQLSFRSAGGTGSTWPVSWAGIFIDLVGMKKVATSIAPTPVSMITRDTPCAIPTV